MLGYAVEGTDLLFFSHPFKVPDQTGPPCLALARRLHPLCGAPYAVATAFPNPHASILLPEGARDAIHPAALGGHGAARFGFTARYRSYTAVYSLNGCKRVTSQSASQMSACVTYRTKFCIVCLRSNACTPVHGVISTLRNSLLALPLAHRRACAINAISFARAPGLATSFGQQSRSRRHRIDGRCSNHAPCLRGVGRSSAEDPSIKTSEQGVININRIILYHVFPSMQQAGSAPFCPQAFTAPSLIQAMQILTQVKQARCGWHFVPCTPSCVLSSAAA